MDTPVGSDLCAATVHRGRGLEGIGTGKGEYEAVVRDRHGNVKQVVPFHNVRTLEGYGHMLATGFGGEPQVPQWFLGLKGPGTPTENDTHESHPAWSEITAYDEPTRQVWSPGAVAAATDGGRQIDNFASVATFTASGALTVSGAFMASVALKGSVGATGWAPVPALSDDFTGADSSAPNPSLWNVSTSGTAGADIQGNRLHLSTSDGANADVTSLSDATDARIDLDVEIPAAASPGEFYFLVVMRGSASARYFVRLYRESGTDEPKADLRKLVGGNELFLDTDPGLLTLTNSVLRYNVRLQVEGTGVKVAVRDFSLGPIPEGAWDLEGVDNDLTEAGHFGPILFGNQGDRDVFVDNFVLSKSQVGIIPSVGNFPSPIALTASDTISARARLIGRGAV